MSTITNWPITFFETWGNKNRSMKNDNTKCRNCRHN